MSSMTNLLCDGLRPHERRTACFPMSDPFNPCSASSASVLEEQSHGLNITSAKLWTKINSKSCKCFRYIPANKLNKATLLSQRNFHRGKITIFGKGFSKFIFTDIGVKPTNIYLKKGDNYRLKTINLKVTNTTGKEYHKPFYQKNRHLNDQESRSQNLLSTVVIKFRKTRDYMKEHECNVMVHNT